eukprot:762413-Hanusia_phi.AAC.4
MRGKGIGLTSPKDPFLRHARTVGTCANCRMLLKTIPIRGAIVTMRALVDVMLSISIPAESAREQLKLSMAKQWFPVRHGTRDVGKQERSCKKAGKKGRRRRRSGMENGEEEEENGGQAGKGLLETF